MVRESPWIRLLGPIVCLVLILIFFGPVLFRDNQLSFRDAGHYYYPLYKLVQREWNAGRWPLWEPEENSGMPLMGNPTAAVLYPGKIVYALFPYPIAAKVYIVGHTILAFGTMILALRSWGMSHASSLIGGLSYAFGAPILFQYCNVIFLVGAAWLPLGFRAVDRWLRQGNRWGLLELALVLALQTMGGDPQVSYLLGFAAAVHAIQLSWLAALQPTQKSEKSVAASRKSSRLKLWLGCLVSLALWIVATLTLARVLPPIRPPGPPPLPFPWMRWLPYVVAVGWLSLIAWWWTRPRNLARRRLVSTMLVGLIGSAVLAGGLSAAQILPVAEFTAQTNRAAEGGPHDIYPFSLEPLMLAQFIWPNVFGTHFPDNTFWVEAFHWPAIHRTIWVPSLYIGGLGLILGLSALGFREGPPWKAWMSGIVIFSTLGSLGLYTSPIWVTRAIDVTVNGKPSATKSLVKPVGPLGIGPIDGAHENSVRLDSYLRDGDGGFYWALSTFLPGFGQFRYPSKMLTFTCFGLSALAALGWEGILRGDRRRALRLSWGLLAITVVLLTASGVLRGPFLKLIQEDEGASQWGPFEPELAYRNLMASLLQTTVLLAVGIGLFRQAAKRPMLTGLVAVVLVASDLSIANTRLILYSPQKLYEGEPEALRIIREAEAKEPTDGPYRIHRMPIWNPVVWNHKKSSTRVEDYTRWERDTIQPKYGITENIEYTQTLGVTELYDYEWFFGAFPRKARPAVAKMLGVEIDTPVVYFPRRSYDMWNTRYFVVPTYPNHWTDGNRGYASFLDRSEVIFPDPARFRGPDGEKKFGEWMQNEDYQILRNDAMYPRAWVVHDYRSFKTVSGLNRENREGPMTEITYQADLIWNNPDLRVFDPRELAWVEEDKMPELQAYRGKRGAGSAEKVTVRYPDPQHVELDCNLETPGMVVLADVYYPGWKLTIDGKPAPIYRANRLMRGAAVPAGSHQLVYSFEPDSFQYGLILSAASIVGSLLFAGFCVKRPRSPLISLEDLT